MFYGGLAGAVITLPLAIYLFIKLDMVQVLEDLTGFRLRKANKRNFQFHRNKSQATGEQTSSESRLRKKGERRTSQLARKRAPVPEPEPTELLQETEHVAETTLLTGQDETTLLTGQEETTLLTEVEAEFVVEEDVVIVHSPQIIRNDHLVRG